MKLERIRVHELAKVMNTTAKRIIEKLAEIGITKSTMSYLEPDEYDKLRQHLGMQPVNKGTSQTESGEKAATGGVKTPTARPRTTSIGQSNTIIRRRFVAQEEETPKKQSSAPRSTSSSGLRAGYVVREESEMAISKKPKAPKKETEKKTAVVEETVAVEETKPVVEATVVPEEKQPVEQKVPVEPVLRKKNQKSCRWKRLRLLKQKRLQHL